MKLLSILFFAAVFFASSQHSLAQAGHVYEDSAILYPSNDEETAITEEEVISTAEIKSDDETNNYFPDTFIKRNRHFLSADSFSLLQNDQQFLYAKNLDSLLKDLKMQAEERERRQKNNSGSTLPNDASSQPTFFEKLFNSKMLQYVLWGMAGLFVLFVVYKLAFAQGGMGKQAAATDGNVKVLDEEGKLPTTDKNFDTFIDKAKRENNYRLAVRYLYLQLLQRLTAVGAIEPAVDKTNTEYLNELVGKPYKETVAVLTRYYDYAWYGEFEMDAALYAIVESKFKNLSI